MTKRKVTLAESADKYVCYQNSVQSPEHEIEFFEQAYQDQFDRKPLVLREDFCGTFAVCCEWVKSDKRRVATGVDLDPEPINWGMANNLAELKKKQRSRVTILQQDVRQDDQAGAEVLAAQNFSFWLFKTRTELLKYFRCARANMAQEGIMIMDMMGGGQCFDEGHVDVKKVKKGKNGYRYLWEQARFNPINNDASFYISFNFNDGSRLERAFEYHWRFWSIAEVRELLAEAGFSESHVYWEETDEDGEDTGEWSRVSKAESQPSWIAYIVAIK